MSKLDDDIKGLLLTICNLLVHIENVRHLKVANILRELHFDVFSMLQRRFEGSNCIIDDVKIVGTIFTFGSIIVR